MSQVSRGFIWSAAERFSIQGIGFLLSIIIARIVSPSSYGLIVMIQVFLSFSQLFIDSGFANALIQKKNRNEIDYYTVFIFNMVVAASIYCLLFIAAPYIADFYNEPQLTNITRVVSLNLILSSLSIVQKTRLTINLDFKTQTKAGLIAVIISGIVGIICAYSGMEVWALVIQGLLSTTIITLALMYFSRWMPKLQFSRESFNGLFKYGSKLLANNILTSIYINIYNLVIGKKYSSADLAFYNRAFTLSQFPSSNIAEVLNRVIFPIMTKVQDDRDKLKECYFKYLHLSHYIILPLMGLLIVLAKPLIIVLLTEKWLPTVPYLQIFCVNFMLYPILQQSGNPVAAIGHVGILLKYQFVKRAVSLIILLVTIGMGIPAICIGVVVSSIFETCINVFVEKKEIGIGYMEQIKTQMDVILLTAVACIIAYLPTLFIGNSLLQLISGGLLGVIIFFAGTYLFNIQEKEYVAQMLISLRSRIKLSKDND